MPYIVLTSGTVHQEAHKLCMLYSTKMFYSSSTKMFVIGIGLILLLVHFQVQGLVVWTKGDPHTLDSFVSLIYVHDHTAHKHQIHVYKTRDIILHFM